MSTTLSLSTLQAHMSPATGTALTLLGLLVVFGLLIYVYTTRKRARARDEEQAVLEAHLGDADLQVAFICRSMNMSRTQLHRKLKALTGLSTSQYVRQYRLQQARKLLQATDLTISEVAYSTGFSNLSWFSQAYRQTFHESPSETRK